METLLTCFMYGITVWIVMFLLYKHAGFAGTTTLNGPIVNEPRVKLIESSFLLIVAATLYFCNINNMYQVMYRSYAAAGSSWQAYFLPTLMLPILIAAIGNAKDRILHRLRTWPQQLSARLTPEAVAEFNAGHRQEVLLVISLSVFLLLVLTFQVIAVYKASAIDMGKYDMGGILFGEENSVQLPFNWTWAAFVYELLLGLLLAYSLGGLAAAIRTQRALEIQQEIPPPASAPALATENANYLPDQMLQDSDNVPDNMDMDEDEPFDVSPEDEPAETERERTLREALERANRSLANGSEPFVPEIEEEV